MLEQLTSVTFSDLVSCLFSSCSWFKETIPALESHVTRYLHEVAGHTIIKKSTRNGKTNLGGQERTVVGSHMTVTGEPLSVATFMFFTRTALAIETNVLI